MGYWEQQAAAREAWTPADGQPYPPPGQPPGPGYPTYPPPPRDHPRATTALVLGLIAIVGGVTCYLPLLLGPIAWSVGRGAVRAIDAEPYRYGGRGQAMAGYVLGVVSTVLLLLGAVAVAAFLLFAFATTSGGPGGVGGVSAWPHREGLP